MQATWHGQIGMLAPGFRLSLAPYSRALAIVQGSLKNHVGTYHTQCWSPCCGGTTLPAASKQAWKESWEGLEETDNFDVHNIYFCSVVGFRGTLTFTAKFKTTSLLAQQHRTDHHQNHHG